MAIQKLRYQVSILDQFFHLPPPPHAGIPIPAYSILFEQLYADILQSVPLLLSL
jgi:hypothetical protein